jgi:dehypoxanthine futalosine cyclase
MTRPSHPSGASPRLSPAEALALLRHGDTAELLGRAHHMRRQMHGRTTCFTHSLNLNPTNLCENRCELCAFWREPDAADAYVMTLDQARERLLAARDMGLTDLHIVGGLQEEIGLEYYEALFRLAREIMPSILIQGLTAVEIHSLADRSKLPVATVLQRLQAAGLAAIPGGGAEIFNASVRERICSKKISADDWLAVHRQAHGLGLPSNATMLFGHLETAEDIIDHLRRLRDLQDVTGGFKAFIPLPFQPSGTRVAVERGPGGFTVARVVAISRLFLDNVPHIRMLVNYVDRKLLQVLLEGGVDDVGGTSLDERIAKAAGAPTGQRFGSIPEMASFITGLGLTPRLVNSRYEAADSKQKVGTEPDPPKLEEALCLHSLEGRPPCRPPGFPSKPMQPTLALALSKARCGERLSAAEAVVLLDEAGLDQLGSLAHQRRLQQVPGQLGTFVIDRNLSSTNVCEAGCKFCAFHVAPGSGKGFCLTAGEILQQVVESVERGATQVLIQGGLNPDLDLTFYERLFTAIKQKVAVCIHSLSPAEITYLARKSGLSLRETLERLRRAGLDSLPGGGAEILVDAVRQQVSPEKINTRAWLAVMEVAQELGMKTTATMVYGLGETTAQRVEHLLHLRELQDKTGGFTAFIPWSFQPNKTQWVQHPATGPDYLRMVALARLFLDNIEHVQAGWVTEGPDLAQLALVFGADDFGGVLMDEQVVRATGTSYAVAPGLVVALIAQTGLIPAQRDTQYTILHRFPA